MTPPDELKIQTWPPREKGGQHVGTQCHGIHIEHLPTGTIAIVTCARSQHINKQIAEEMILSAITHPKFS